ncbi:MAG TPA: PQQ-binding-like beta-propeller repeat protein [Thermoanaerobaculia bacterium]|nr:PQQ-binding-like beta-propeller repeat protein [Thermoanaerobaculia bacterium]
MRLDTRLRPAGLALLVASGLLLGAADWSQWRGPNRSGHVGDPLPVLTGKPTQAWKVEVGEGHSSPVVADGVVYQHARQGEEEVVLALDLGTGHQLWRQATSTPYQMNPAAVAHGKGPKSTPVVAGTRVCTLGISGALSCFDRVSGRLLWRHYFEGRFPTTAPEFGTAMSPMVVGDALVAHVGGLEEGAIAAFRLEDGVEVWRWSGDGPGYASPVIATLGDGPPQLVTQTRAHLVGLDAESGQLLWMVPFETAYDQNSVTPVVFGDTVIFSGLDQGTFALRVRREAGSWTATEVWRNADVPQYMSSPVLHDGLLFGLSHLKRGQLFCLDAATGGTVWLSEGRIGVNASLLLAGDRLVVSTTDGVLLVGSASRSEWQPESRHEIATTPVWAHPAPVRDGILVKDRTTLALWRFEG